MPLSVTVTSTKLILSASGLQIRFNGQDIVEAKPVPRNIPNTIPQSQEWYVSLKLTGAAKEVYENGIYELRLLDIDPSSQPTWTNNQAGAEQAAADISVMIRSVPGGGGGGQVDTIVPGPGVDVDSTDPANPIVSTRQKNSIEVDANELQLVGDEASPGNDEYYGTDGSGNKGFHPLPSPGAGDVVGPASSTNNNVPQWDGVTGKLLKDGLGTSTGGNNAADGGKLVRFRADGDIYFSNNNGGAPSVSALSGGTGDGLYATSDTGDGVHSVSTAGKAVHAIAAGAEPAVHANGQSTGLALEAEQNGGGGADIALFHDGSGDGLEVKTDGGLEWTSATGAQTTADNLPVFGALTKGVVPAAGAVPAATNFLDETGAWSAPPAPAGAALTRTDDSNVTLTLGGSPSTALLAAASITAGWTGQLSIARGGTNAATEAAALTNLGIIRAALTSAFVSNSASFVDVTGMTLTVPAGKTARFTFYVPYSSATTTVGIGLSMTVTGSPLLRHFTRFTPTNATGTPVRAMISSDDAGAVNATTGAASTNYGIEMNGVVVADASPCVVQLRMAVGGTPANITLAAGSSMMATLID